MQIEVLHNPDSLPIKKVFFVENPTRAYARAQKIMEVKRPRGMRVRYAYDVKKKQMSFEGRSSLPVDTLIRELKKAFYMKQIG